MAVIGESPLGASVTVYTNTPLGGGAVEIAGSSPPDWHAAAYQTPNGSPNAALPYVHGTPLNASKTPALLGEQVAYLVDTILTTSGRAVQQARPLSTPLPVMAYNSIGQVVITAT